MRELSVQESQKISGGDVLLVIDFYDPYYLGLSEPVIYPCGYVEYDVYDRWGYYLGYEVSPVYCESYTPIYF